MSVEDTQFEEPSFSILFLQTELPIISILHAICSGVADSVGFTLLFHLFSWVLSLGFVFFVEALLLVVV